MFFTANYSPFTRRRYRHNKLHGITPSVAKAASVGDSILDSINRNDVLTQRAGMYKGAGIDDASDLSWAGHALPPDQVISSSWFLGKVHCAFVHPSTMMTQSSVHEDILMDFDMLVRLRDLALILLWMFRLRQCREHTSRPSFCMQGPTEYDYGVLFC